MIWMLLGVAVGGPAYGLAQAECRVSKHTAAVRCKKGVCLLEEELRYYKPDCVGQVRFHTDEVIDPVVSRDGGWALSEPCEPGVECIERVTNGARILRVIPVGSDGSFSLTGDATISAGAGVSLPGGPGSSVLTAKTSRKVALVPVPEASAAVASSSTFSGPMTEGLRSGAWLAADPSGRPLVREIRYDQGVRLGVGDWEARTLTTLAGAPIAVDELGSCPAGSQIDTALGKQLTQSCAWTDDSGAHARVASFDLDPWQIRSVEEVLNNRRSGPTVTWSEEGVMLRREYFSMGKSTGLLEQFHPDGSLAERLERAPDGAVMSRELYAADGQLLEVERSNIPGMADQRYSARFDAEGLLVEERRPISAAVTEVRTRGPEGLLLESLEREWEAPETGCRADIDCPVPPATEARRGICDAGVCRKVDTLKFRLGDRVPLRDAAPLDAALREAVGQGRQAWLNPNLISSPAHTCVAVQVEPRSILPDGPDLSARTEMSERVEGDKTVLRWTELDLEGAELSVASRAAVEGSGGLEPYAASQGFSIDLVLSKVDQRAAHYALEAYELEAVCAPLTAYEQCPKDNRAFGRCESQTLVVREPMVEAPRMRTQERPEYVTACELTCSVDTCPAEAGRVAYALERRRFQRPQNKGYALWWTEQACNRSIGLP